MESLFEGKESAATEWLLFTSEAELADDSDTAAGIVLLVAVCIRVRPLTPAALAGSKHVERVGNSLNPVRSLLVDFTVVLCHRSST